MSKPNVQPKPGKEWRLVLRYSYPIAKISIARRELADIKTGDKTLEEHLASKLSECLSSLLGVKITTLPPEGEDETKEYYGSESGFSKDILSPDFEVSICERKWDWKQVKIGKGS